MRGKSSQTVIKLLARWQTHSATALDTQQACNLAAAQRLLTTASQSTPSQPASQPADNRSEQLAYSQNLRELRKTWQEERAQKLAAKARADAIRDANKAKSVEAHRRNVSAMKELRMQIHEEKRRLQMAELAQRQAIAAQWRSATDSIYADLKDKRRHDLLQESRDWITPETLSARITEALENPVNLYEETEDEWQTSERQTTEQQTSSA